MGSSRAMATIDKVACIPDASRRSHTSESTIASAPFPFLLLPFRPSRTASTPASTQVTHGAQGGVDRSSQGSKRAKKAISSRVGASVVAKAKHALTGLEQHVKPCRAVCLSVL